MNYQDQTLVCKDCGKSFVFTARDQEFFAQKGYTNIPKYCRDCRLKRKKAQEVAATKVLYKIKCKNCGKEGEMATEPRKSDDVLCSDCFYRAFKEQHGDNSVEEAASEQTAATSE